MSASDTKVTIRSATTPNDAAGMINITMWTRGEITRSRDDESVNNSCRISRHVCHPDQTGSNVDQISASDTKTAIRSATTPNDAAAMINITMWTRGNVTT